jgi:uncharacterized protein (TIGR03437 family)
MRPLLVLALTALTVHAQSSVESRQMDLNYVANQLPQVAPNFFANLSRATFQQAVNNLQTNLATLTDAEFFVNLAQLVAMPGDAHTYLYLGEMPGTQTFPFHLRWLDDGVFVTSAGPEYLETLGARIVAIAGVPIEQVVEQLGTVIPHENEQWLHYQAQTYLLQQQTLQGLGISAATAATPITFQNLDGSQVTLPVTPSTEARISLISADTGFIPDYLVNPSTYYSFNYIPATRMLYFKYNVCQNDPTNPFASFATSFLNTLDTNPVDTLVLDFRGNTGGSDSLFNPLYNGVVKRLGTLRQNPNFALYIVVDKGTFSSGMDDAEIFKQPGLAVPARVIGESTGGKPAHYGNVKPFTLPGSLIPGQYSTTFNAAPGYISANDLSFEPDIPISTRSTDYFARFDPVMAAMLARSPGPPPGPSGEIITVNGASFRTDQGVAAGALAAAFGQFPAVPDGVLVGGAAAQVLSASSSQVNFIVPPSAAAGTELVSVTVGGQPVAAGTVTISAAGPGLFVLQPNPQQPGAVENQDFSVNSPSNPAVVASVAQIFATGYGGDGLPVRVFFGDTPAQILFSGAVAPGLWQINAAIPSGTAGLYPIFVLAGGFVSNAVTVAVQ